MAKILVTGAAGFIGWYTSKLLLNEGWEVVGIDNMNNYYNPLLKEYRIDDLQRFKDFSFHRIDISEFSNLEAIFKNNKFEAVINLGARAGVRNSLIDPWVYLSSNINGTVNLLELMKIYSIPKFILASSSSLYAGQNPPFSEEQHVNNPLSPYAASKKSAEMMAYSYHHLYGIDISILRYFTVFGPCGRPDMSYFNFIESILRGNSLRLFGDGNQTRDFTYVEDIAMGTVAALKKVGFEIINLGGGRQPYSINYMIDLIEKLTSREALIERSEFHKADMDTTWALIDKAKKLLNWEPLISFEKGIQLTVDWHLSHRDFLEKWF